MAKWQFDGSESRDYPGLGFVAAPGQILDAPNAPDSRWSAASAGAAETVTRYGASGIVPALFTEPADGAALVYNATSNVYEPTATSLNAAYATPATVALSVGARSFLGASFAFYGDSQTNSGEGYPYYAALLSQGSIRAAHVLSNPGWTSTTLQGSFDTQVVAANPTPTAVVILAGANDAQASTPLATYRANIESMVSKARGAGIAPVLVTVPPNNNDTYDGFVRTYNAWLSRYAEVNRIPLVDFYTLLVDQATGDWKAAYDNGDGLHPNNAANKALGQAIYDTLKPLLTPRPYLLQAFTGSPNLMPNSNFLVDTNSDGLADSTSATPSTGFSYSRVTDAAGFRWQRMTLSGATGTKQILSTEIKRSDGKYNTGDLIRFAARVRNGQPSTKFIVQLTQYTDAYAVAQNRILTSPVPNGMTQQVDGVIIGEVTIQATTTKLVWSMQGEGDGTYDIAQPTIYNLTALGIV